MCRFSRSIDGGVKTTTCSGIRDPVAIPDVAPFCWFIPADIGAVSVVASHIPLRWHTGQIKTVYGRDG